MKTNLRNALLASLAILAVTGPAFATTCRADITLLPSGVAMLSAVTDARGAVAVLIYDASGRLLQRIALVNGGASGSPSFAVLPGQHFDAAFVNKKGTILCVDPIDVAGLPSPTGGIAAGGSSQGLQPDGSFSR